MTRRAVIAADPAAARQRQERAQREARVERWTEHAGTGALAGRDLPPIEVLAADQYISELAQALQATGLGGTMDQLRALVFVALLTGQPVASLIPPDASRTGAGPDGPTPSCGQGDNGFSGGHGGLGALGGSAGVGALGGSGDPGLSAAPMLRGAINLTMPLDTWVGLGEVPGEVAGFGPVGAQDCRDLALAMAQHPGTRWCLTLIDESGRPVAHGCARPRCGPPGGDPGSQAGPGPPPSMTPWVAGVPLRWLEAGRCSHTRESASYRPPESLQHLIRVRQQACAFPGCPRAARRCDLDHTIPHDRGGPTCECNLAPLCRTHHQAKQTSGWQLEQPQPGIMTWTTPSGRRYTTYPAVYPT